MAFVFIFLLLSQITDAQVIIGTGTSTQRYPFNFYYGYGRDAAIYTAAEMNTVSVGGTITTLAWYSGTSTTTGAVVIYLKTVGTTTQVASDTWANTISGATTVWSGTTPTWTNNAWNTIDITDFNIPANENLLVLVECNYTGSGGGGTSGTAFRYSTAGTNSHAYWQTDTNPPAGTPSRNTSRPNITLGGLTAPLPPNCATLNTPINGATNVNLNTPLVWNAPATGPAPSAYKVYLGTSNPPTTFSTVNAPTTTYIPSGQAYSTTYYWYVVPTGTGGDAVGCNSTVFSYTTSAPPPPPANDECTGAINIPVTNQLATQPIAGTMESATPSTGTFSTNCNSFSDSKDVWYKLTVPTTGNVVIETFVKGGTTNSENDFSFQIYTGGCGTLTYVNCDEDSGDLGIPTQYMPVIYLTGQTPGAELLIRLRKTTASRNEFTIAAYDPTTPLPLSSSNCAAGTLTIDIPSGNGYRFVPLLDGSGNLVGELFAYGQNLGAVSSSVKIGTLRQDANGVYFMARSATVTVANQPTSSVDMYMYCTDAEYTALVAADPSITGLAAVKATKTTDPCGLGPKTGGTLLTNYHQFTRTGDNAHAFGFSPTSFSTFFLHGGAVPLPVDLLVFNAEPYAQKQVKLTWTVANEANLQKYVIERSADGKHFSCIGAVSSLGKSQYIFMDSAPLQGTNYYRLVSLDHDTKEHYSMIRMVNLGKDKTLALFPNPVSQDLMITGLDQNQQVQYLIYNEMGQLVNISTVSGETLNTKGIDVANLASGQYCIRLVGSDFIQTLKFSKL